MYFSASKLIRGLESCMIEQQPAVYAEKIDYKKLLNVFDEDGKKKNSADPFVIALAKENFCKAVAEQVRTRNESSPKIPDVCDRYNIECLDFVGFACEAKLNF